MKKLFAIFIAFFGILFCGVGISPVSAEAAEGGASITISDTSAYQGDYVYLYIRANNFEDVASLELSLVYDADVFEVRDVYTSSLMPSDAFTSENGDNAGMVGLYAVSLSGINGSGNLWYVALQVKANVPVGSHSVQILAGECLDSTLNPVSISTSGCKVTVNERAYQPQTIWMYSSVSDSNLYEGDEVTVTFYTYELAGLAAAEMEVEYDKSFLALNRATLGSALDRSNTISSVNTDTDGFIKISYIAMNGVTGSANPFLTLTFTVKDNVDAHTSVSLSLGGLYDVNLNPMACNGATATLSLQKRAEEIVLPMVFVSSIADMGDTFTVNVVAEGSTGLAAGDFTIKYDAVLLECVSVNGNEDYLVIANNKVDEGMVTFSFIAMHGISEDTKVVSLTFAKKQDAPFEAEISISGAGLTDSGIQPIKVAYRSGLITSLCHVWGTIAAKQPTCTEFGWKEYEECSVCGEIRGYDEISATGHTLSDWIVTKDATCEEAGSQHKICTVCQKELAVEEILATGHNYGEWIAEKSATCEDTGVKGHYHCDACNKDFDIEKHELDELIIPAKGHNYGEWIAEIPATCEATGIKGHYHCDACNKDFDIEKNELNNLTVEATGHNYGEWLAEVPATCEGTGVKGHYHCDACGKDFDLEKSELSNLTIEATGHTSSDWIVTKAATCEEAGSQHKVCKVCDKELAVEGIPATGHTSSDWIVTKDATCEEAGSQHKICTVCSVELEVESIPALGHKYGDWTTANPATCTDKGLEERVCEHDNTHKETRQTEALGHKWQKVEGKTPTCTEDGWTEYEQCSVCYEIRNRTELSATGHTYSEWIITKPATCEEAGSRHKVCTVCSEELEVESISKLGHKYGNWTTVNPATCTDKGLEERVCENDNTHKETRDIEALGHKWQKVEGKTPTCTETGWTEYEQCSVCNEIRNRTELSATGHTYSEWIITKPATCEEAGSRHKVCTVCEEELEVEAIPALGHKYGEWRTVTEAKCTEKGLEERVCEHDNTHKETRQTEALGHDIEHHEAKAATCRETGWKEYDTCKRCGYTTYESIPATGHTEEVIPGKAPTCTETGLTEGKKCSVCGEILEAQEVISAAGHNSSDWIVAKEASEGVAGYRHKECTECGEILEEEDIEALPVNSTGCSGTGCGSTTFGGGMAGFIGLLLSIPAIFWFNKKSYIK